jgi:3-oxoadipate enol-lactonase
MPYLSTDDGIRLWYQLDGSENAPVLVLSNSLGTNLAMWEPQIPALLRYFRVLRYDTRGHGKSDVPRHSYSVERLGRDVLVLLDGLGIKRAHFCGLSMGGMTGMWLACQAPDRIDRLALCNTAARIGPAEIWDKRIDAVRAGGMASILPGVMERWFTAPFREQAPDKVEGVAAMLRATSPEGYIAACAAIRDMDQRHSIAAIRAKTLVITGSSDLATPPSDGRYLADCVAGARYVELPAAHLSNIEAANRFTEALLQFLVN